jgi:phospholipase C
MAEMPAVDRAIARRHLRHRDQGHDLAARPDPSQPAGSDCLPPINHIVVLMMENHSFDNYFGTLGHGEGLEREPDGTWGPANERLDGGVVRPFHLFSTVQLPDVPTQSWHASHVQYADGRNDGFVRSVEETLPGRDPRVPMGYWTADDLPFYADLARTYTLADRWHCSLLGPTFPNRRFLMAATADGLIDDVLCSVIDYPRTGTVFDLLDRHGIPWVNYHHVRTSGTVAKRVLGSAGLRTGRAVRLGAAGLFGRGLKTGLDNMQFTANLYPLGIWRCLRRLRHIDRFFSDARDGKLPAFSIVDPDFCACSEENPEDVRVGEGFAAAVIQAVTQGKGWPNTVLFWLYDEHGGYFDHVPPPAAAEPDGVLPRSLFQSRGPLRWLLRQLGDWKKLSAIDSGAGCYDRLGFRVPAVVVSPFAKPGHVSHQVYDHTSVLKLLEHKWNLPPLTARDAEANDPVEMLDLDRPALLNPPELAAPAIPWRVAGT